jgi:hypothetical protein
MTTLAGDHSTAGAIIGAALKQAGMGAGLIRYACGGRSDVNITAAEVADLRAHGVSVGIVLEHQADWLLSMDSVPSRVLASREVTRSVGLPDGVTYMAADWDCTNGGPVVPGGLGERNLRSILTSLQRAATVIGPDNVGFYGSKFAIDWLLIHAPWLRWYWQTEAWSQGERSQHACLYQRAQSVSVAGVVVDVDEVWKPQWGQRAHPQPKPIDHHYEDYPDATFRIDGRVFNERQLAKDIDHWLEHPHIHHHALSQALPLALLARKRVWVVSVFEPPDFKTKRPKPAWGEFKRGSRYQWWSRRIDRMRAVVGEPQAQIHPQVRMG